MSRTILRALFAMLPLLLAACGGGGGGGTSSTTTTSYRITGSVSGLADGTSLTLYDQFDGDSLTVSASGSFAFAQPVASGSNYAVTISGQPSGQQCFVTDGLGVVGTSDVTSVKVACSKPYSVGGTISGLSSGTVTLIDNSRDSVSIPSGTTSFTFTQKLSDGQAYNVAVAAQPAGATCVVGHGTGVVSGADVTTVTVSCSTTTSAEYLYTGTTSGSGVYGYKIGVDPGGNGSLTAVNSVSGNPYNVPVAMATDAAGAYLYVVNDANDTVTSLSITSGALATVSTPPATATGSNPYGIAVRPDGKFVYVANANDGTVSVFASASGVLSPVGSPVPTGGTNPESLVVSPTGSFLYVLNFGSDTLSTFAIDSTTGALTRVGSPVATGVNPFGVQASVTPGGLFLYVANYGANSISAYSLASNGVPSPLAGSPFPAGHNPFAVAVNPAGTRAYVANEADNTVSTYAIDPTYGTLTAVKGSLVSTGTGPEGIAVDPSGQYLYVSNYTAGSISKYAIDQSTGAPQSPNLSEISGLGNPKPLLSIRP